MNTKRKSDDPLDKLRNETGTIIITADDIDEIVTEGDRVFFYLKNGVKLHMSVKDWENLKMLVKARPASQAIN